MPTRRSKAVAAAAAAAAKETVELVEKPTKQTTEEEKTPGRATPSNKRTRANEQTNDSSESDTKNCLETACSVTTHTHKKAKRLQSNNGHNALETVLSAKNGAQTTNTKSKNENCDDSVKSDWDAQTLTTINDRLRDELAQVRTELEHSQRLLQLNMGRAPILDDRACQSETAALIEQYDNIRKSTQLQLIKMKPSHPKYWWWEYAHHLNTEMCRLVRESWTYRGFSV